jgi:hypothetical protein
MVTGNFGPNLEKFKEPTEVSQTGPVLSAENEVSSFEDFGIPEPVAEHIKDALTQEGLLEDYGDYIVLNPVGIGALDSTSHSIFRQRSMSLPGGERHIVNKTAVIRYLLSLPRVLYRSEMVVGGETRPHHVKPEDLELPMNSRIFMEILPASEQIRLKVEYILEKNGFLSIGEQGQRIVSMEELIAGDAFGRTVNHYRDGETTVPITSHTLYDYLRENPVVERDVYEKDHTVIPSIVVREPASISDMLRGDYGDQGSGAFYWDIVKGPGIWSRNLKLQDGEVVTGAELRLAYELARHRAMRSKDGSLIITNPETGEKTPFSADSFSSMMQTPLMVSSDKENPLGLRSGYSYVSKYAPNIVASNILRLSDFRRLTSYEKAENYGVEPKMLGGRPDLTFVSAPEQEDFTPRFLRYYMGRNTLVGTDLRLYGQKMEDLCEFTQLDSSTIGVVEKVHGKKLLRYTFSLLSNTEESELVQKAEEEGVKTPYVGSSMMKERIQKYQSKDYLRNNSGVYDQKDIDLVPQFDDFDFVAGTFRELMQSSGIGIHRLSWRDQMIIARASLEERSTSRLLSFAKEFGLDGLRTFLSFEDGGEGMGEVILELAETKKIEQDVLSDIFVKYGSIVDHAEDITGYIKGEFPGGVAENSQVVQQVQKRMFQSGVQLLKSMHKKVIANTQLDSTKLSQEILESLEQLNIEALGRFDTLKYPRTNGLEVSLDDVASYERRTQQLSDMSQEQATAIANMYRADRLARAMWDATTESFYERILSQEEGLQATFIQEGSSIEGFYIEEPYTPGGDYPDGILLSAFTVSKDAEKSTFATQFLQETFSGQLYDEHLYGYVDDTNRVALNLYKKLGFTTTDLEYSATDPAKMVHRPPLVSAERQPLPVASAA